MGIFGRSRASTTSQISQPVLTYSDAAPREDLQAISPVDTLRPLYAETGRTIQTSNSKGHPQPHQHIVEQFDFTVAEPPEDFAAASESAHFNDAILDANAIGIALGSPSMAPPPPQYHSIEMNLSHPSSSEKQQSTAGTGSLRRKTSKWRKLGGLLKARQSEMRQTREGFYQLDMDRSQDEAASDYQHRPTRTSFSQNVKRSPQRRGNKGDVHQANAGGSLLKVDIPTVQMERYSVMFHSVLGDKPSSSLLARRSKALDQLHVQPPEAYKPQRRATSPGPSRSPAAAYGDIKHKKDDKSNNGFPPRSPLRSNTYPRAAALSKFNNSHLAVPDLTPALSTGTSLNDFSPEEPSPISFDSPVLSRNHMYRGDQPSPIWEMVTKQPSVSANASARSTPVTTPLAGTDVTSPKIKSLPLLPSRQASLPPRLNEHAIKTRTMAVTTEENEQQQEDENEENEDDVEDDQILLIQHSKENPSPKLLRSKTVPLPLGVTKHKSQTQPTQPRNTNAKAATSSSPPSTTIDSDETQFPQTIEISIARSVSVARRAPKQTLVPLGASLQVFHNANERFGEHQKLLPTLVDVGGGQGGGHRRPKSQNIVIETL